MRPTKTLREKIQGILEDLEREEEEADEGVLESHDPHYFSGRRGGLHTAIEKLKAALK